MSTGNDIAWAKRLRAQLARDIETLRARAQEGGGHAEELGLLPDGDRLSELYRRLEQVDRLIHAMEDAEPHLETDVPAHLGNQATPKDPAAHAKR